jgi:hypothetical protein
MSRSYNTTQDHEDAPVDRREQRKAKREQQYAAFTHDPKPQPVTP